MRTEDEIKEETDRKGVLTSHLLEVLLDIRGLLEEKKKK